MNATDALRNAAPTLSGPETTVANPDASGTLAGMDRALSPLDRSNAMNESGALAVAVRLNKLKLELERLKLANALGVKVARVTDGMVCLERAQGQRNVRYVLAK